MYCLDNYDAFRQYEADRERALAKLPECSECGEKITDEQCYEIGDMLFCPNCIEQNKVYTENYMKE